MITTILTFHLAMVAFYLLSLITVAAATIVRKPMASAVKVAYSSFGAIIVSGIGLVALSPKSMTHFCVSALACTLVGILISQVYKRRVIAFHTA